MLTPDQRLSAPLVVHIDAKNHFYRYKKSRPDAFPSRLPYPANINPYHENHQHHSTHKQPLSRYQTSLKEKTTSSKMAEPHSTPRISSPHLDHFTSKTVRIVGKVQQLRGDTATIDADGVVTLQLGHDSHLTVGHAVEVVGKVNQDLTVKVFRSTDLGKNGTYWRNRARDERLMWMYS